MKRFHAFLELGHSDASIDKSATLFSLLHQQRIYAIRLHVRVDIEGEIGSIITTPMQRCQREPIRYIANTNVLSRESFVAMVLSDI